MNTYVVVCANYLEDGVESISWIINAETPAKAKYKAYQLYCQKYNTSPSFNSFISIILISIKKKEANHDRPCD